VSTTSSSESSTLSRDFIAGMVVFLVALPLCLGIALASNAEPFAGIVSGIIGGIIVGLLSKSHVSVSGPAAGLTAIVIAQLAILGSYQLFLTAVVLAGLIQIVLGFARTGFLSAFFPSSVIKGLLAAIGVILILKQIPHLFGHDTDPEGDMAFEQYDHENTFTEFLRLFGDIHPGAMVIGLASILVLVIWDRWKILKSSLIPAPLFVVLMGTGLSLLLRQMGGVWAISNNHLVNVPVAESLQHFFTFFKHPDFYQMSNPALYTAAITIAAVASLETLLNIEAVDKIDPKQRNTPPNRELVAQGIGNTISGMIGGLPITSVIVRSSVNINAGARTKLSAIVHGCLLLLCVLLLPAWLNLIPLSCLAAVLLMTGIKLVSPALIKQMWNEGRNQFIPFAVTVVAIVLTDLVVGVLIGLATSIAFILHSNVRRPLSRVMEKHLGGEVVRLEFADQVSFLNRAALSKALDDIPSGGHIMLDARNTYYIDPDILSLIHDFTAVTAPARGVEVSLMGFRERYQLEDRTQYVDYSTRELQSSITPQQVLELLKDGHERFLTGQRLTRDLGRQVNATAKGQHPLAVIVSCIDSRAPAELIFDVGVGDIFNVRVAGNVISHEVLGSVEYACGVAGAKLILVMGHTRCGAVTAAVNLICSPQTVSEATGCDHLDHIVSEIQHSITDPAACKRINELPAEQKDKLIDTVSHQNVVRSVNAMIERSDPLKKLLQQGRIAVVGAMYDVSTGNMVFSTELENRSVSFR
jgi:carbonic anhydrase